MRKMQAFARKPIAVIVMLVLLGVSAHAASIVFFTSREAFQAATGVPRLRHNFNSLADSSSGQLHLDGLQIYGDFRVQGGALNLGPYSRISRRGPLGVNFASEVFAFGLEVWPSAGGGALNIDINGLTAGTTFTGPGYVSFATDFPFRAINLTFSPQVDSPSTSVSFLLDNVVANTIPEPGTLMLLAAGAGIAALYTRRRRPREAAGDGRSEDGTPGPM